MIANDDAMTAAVLILADSKRAAETKYNETTQKNNTGRTYSRLFRSVDGSNNEHRKALAIIDDKYAEAQELEARAIAERERFLNDREWARAIIKIWEVERNDIRAAERVR